MNFKIDIFQLYELGNYDSKTFYYGSLTGTTNKGFSDLISVFHRSNFCIEGLRINAYNLKELVIIELTGFLVDGEYLKNIILNSNDLLIENNNIDEILIKKNEDSDYIIFSDEISDIDFSEIKLEMFNDSNLVFIENVSIVEWGASSYIENFILNIVSNLTSSFIEKILKKGLISDSISRFKLPTKIKNKIANEYNINPNTLFLESYYKDNNSEFITFRNLYFKIEIILENGELKSLKRNELNKYI